MALLSGVILFATGTSAEIITGSYYYVSPDGDNSNSGTIDSPLKTIQAAVDLCAAGDVVEIRGGVYRELVRPRPASTGIPGRSLKIRAYDPDGDGPADPEEVIVSGFEPIVPGVNGAGSWIEHGEGSGIWKIQLTADHGIPSVGLNQVLYNGELLRRERFPSAPEPLDFNYRHMAQAEEGSKVDEVVTVVPGTYRATYQLDALPAGDWSGARILTSPAWGINTDLGSVVSNTADSVTFSYQVVGSYNEAQEGDPFYLYNSLLALDEPGEAFYDVEGVSGPPNTLYLMPPDQASPLTAVVELRSRRVHPGSPTQITNSAFWFTNGVAHIEVENLKVFGANVVAFETASNNISFRGVDVFHGNSSASGIAVSLTSPDCEFVDGSITKSMGIGLLLGEDGVVRNNVISHILREAVFSKYERTTVEQNTVHHIGGVAITLNSKGGVVRRNNVYQSALLNADVAAMNTCSQGDLEGLEVAYNWVHTCNGRYDVSYGWGGCYGIRFDGGCGYPGVSNYVVHHNLICGVSSIYDLACWAIVEGYPNYDDCKVRIYNNTVEDVLMLNANGSFAGADVRNNAAGNFFAREIPMTTISTLESNLFVSKSITGNLTGSAKFEAPALCNYLLTSESPAIDAGQDLGVITQGFAGSAPDLGAFEYGEAPWVAGALMDAGGLDNLSVTQYLTIDCRREIRVEGMPEGRMLPDGFTLRIGSVESGFFRHEIGSDGHVRAAVFEMDTSSLEGTQAIAFSMDGTNFVAAGAVEMIDCSLAISAVTPRRTDAAGGTAHTIQVTGLSGYHRPLIPILFSNLTAADLQTIPVPVIFDSHALISAGLMQADGRDLRVIEFPSTPGGSPRELDYWIESGLGATSTLIWVRNPGGTASMGTSFYLSCGDPNAVSQSDPRVLTDYFDEMALPSLELKLTGDSLAGVLQIDDPVTAWPDLSGFGHDASQSDPGRTPVMGTVSVSGLTGVRLDGIDDYLFVGDGIGPNTPQSTFVVYWNPDPLIDPENGNNMTQRLVSANHHPTRDWLVDPATGTSGLAMNATINVAEAASKPALAHFRSLSTFNFANFTIGAEYLYRDNPWLGAWYRGYICEILVFTEMIAPNTSPNHDHIREYLIRKWGMGEDARGRADLDNLILPLEVLVGGQAATFEIADSGAITFQAPSYSGYAPLPVSVDVEIRRGNDSEVLANSFFYSASNYSTWHGAPALGLDSDGDGLTSLHEYAYGADPYAADFGIGPVVGMLPDSGKREFRVRRNFGATDLMIWLEFSDDLKTWQRLPLHDATQRVIDRDVNGDGSTQLLGIELPNGEDLRQFYRLSLELIQ